MAGVLVVTLMRIVRLMRIVPLVFTVLSIPGGWHIRMSHACVRVMI
jgi:hypothetical protein